MVITQTSIQRRRWKSGMAHTEGGSNDYEKLAEKLALKRPCYFRHHIYSAAALGKLPTPRMGSTSDAGL